MCTTSAGTGELARLSTMPTAGQTIALGWSRNACAALYLLWSRAARYPMTASAALVAQPATDGPPAVAVGDCTGGAAVTTPPGKGRASPNGGVPVGLGVWPEGATQLAKPPMVAITSSVAANTAQLVRVPATLDPPSRIRQTTRFLPRLFDQRLFNGLPWRVARAPSRPGEHLCRGYQGRLLYPHIEHLLRSMRLAQMMADELPANLRLE